MIEWLFTKQALDRLMKKYVSQINKSFIDCPKTSYGLTVMFGT